MDGLSDELLARSRFALQKNRGLGWSNQPDALENLLKGGGFAEDVVEPECSVESLMQGDVFLFEFSCAEGALYKQFEFFQVDWFWQKVESSSLHGFDGGLHVTVGSHHDADWGVGLSRGRVHHAHARGPCHAQVGKHDVETLGFKKIEGFFGVAGLIHVEFFLENLSKSFASVKFVVYD